MPDVEIDAFSLVDPVASDLPVHGKDSIGQDSRFTIDTIADYVIQRIAQNLTVTPGGDDLVVLSPSSSSGLSTAQLSAVAALFSGVSDVTAQQSGGIGVTDTDGDHSLQIDFSNIATENTVVPSDDIILYLDETDGTIKKTTLTNIGLSGAVETGSLAAGSLQLGSSIIKIFNFESTDDGNQTFAFPNPFPNNCFAVIVTGSRFECPAFNWNSSTFQVNRNNDIDGSATLTAIAFGD